MSSTGDQAQPLLGESEERPKDDEASPHRRESVGPEPQGGCASVAIPVPTSNVQGQQPDTAEQQQQQRLGTRVRSNTLLAKILATEIDYESSGGGGGGAARRKNLNTPLGVLFLLFKSLPMQVVMVLLTFTDVSFLLYEFITADVQFAVVTLCTSLMFVLEIMVLWSFQGTTEYFRNDKRWCVAEVLIVVISFTVEYVEYILETTVSQSDFAGYLRYLRAVRFLRVLIIWKTRYRNFTAALRQLVSADRRRYVKDGYDLDLTYVHPKVIAMSWPSSKAESLYRNQIDTVAAFLDEKHANHYRVYNLCSERTYDQSKFHFQCSQYRVDDHSPPELLVMLRFARDVHSFIQKDPRRNVAVIHCKGGKGRTGTMVCTYLLYAGVRDTADSALGHFGLLRTSDEAKSFQGVESPAQDRYVHYFERMIKLPGGPESFPVVRAKFTTFVLHGIPFGWWSGGLDRLWFALIAQPSSQRNVIYRSNPTVTFNGQLPENPFKKRKTKLGGRKASQSPRGGSIGEAGNHFSDVSGAPAAVSTLRPQQDDEEEDDVIRQDNVYSDGDEPTSTQFSLSGATQSNFASGEDGQGGAAACCQPYAANMTIFVNGNVADPMDFDLFEDRYVLADGRGDLAQPSARYLSPGGGAGSATGSTSRMFREGGGRTLRRNIDKRLNVSVAFDVKDMPVFEGDLNIRFFFNQDDPNTLQCNLQTFFHTSFEDNNFLRLSKSQLDGPHKEANKEKKFPKNIELHLEWVRV